MLPAMMPCYCHAAMMLLRHMLIHAALRYFHSAFILLFRRHVDAIFDVAIDTLSLTRRCIHAI